MTDVFISYKREEREQARALAEALAAHGFSVWWDAELLPGEQYRAVTLQILQSCRAAIVIWSPLSIASSWVLDEAQRAMERGVLIPVKLEAVAAYPLGFGQLHAHDLVGWNGDAESAAFQPVLAAVRRLVGAPAKAAAPNTSAAAEAEVAFWRGVQDSREAADFEAYLSRYPQGLFGDLARRRLAALGGEAPARTPRKRGSSAPRKKKAAAEAAKPAPAMQPQPLLGATAPGFTRGELGFVAAAVFVAAFLAWPIANRALGLTGMAFYPGDVPSLFSFDTAHNVFIMTPLLTGLAWGYDRALAWWTARGRHAGTVRAVTLVVLVLFLFFSLAMRENEGRETHIALWLLATWTATTYARAAVAWLRKVVPEFIRLASKGPQ